MPLEEYFLEEITRNIPISSRKGRAIGAVIGEIRDFGYQEMTLCRYVSPDVE
jgi:hypothetical protein